MASPAANSPKCQTHFFKWHEIFKWHKRFKWHVPFKPFRAVQIFPHFLNGTEGILRVEPSELAVAGAVAISDHVAVRPVREAASKTLHCGILCR